MQDPRSFCLALGFGLTLYGSFAAFYGIPAGRAAWRESAWRACLAALALVSLAGAGLLYALATRDYSLTYVVHYTSNALAAPYALSALWAGNDGSLLLWAWMLLLFTAIAVRRARREGEPLWPGVLGTLLGVAAFFLFLISSPLANPFRTFGMPVEDGRGMNPMLQNPGMIFHPPALYVGYVGFAVPFAYAMATLVQRRSEARWFERTRRWSLFAWFFLSLGNLLGAWWAYVTLGWGGYWAWDPVENAGFLPWLTGTAFLHSIMIEERKGMLRVWNMVLIVLTFLLTIFGTFLTRSGVLSSVHAFAESKEFGAAFLAFLFLALGATVVLLVSRLDMLRSARRLDSIVSRESSFLFNNLILVGAAFVVFWGTIYPLVSEAVRGQKVSVLADTFNRILNPMWIALLLLTGLCPLIAWRKVNLGGLGRSLRLPGGVALGAGAALAAAGVRRPLALAVLVPVVFVCTVAAIEFVRGVRARMALAREGAPLALWRLIARNRRRYGGYVIHLGVALMAAGIVGSSLYQTQAEVRIQKGGTAEFAGHKLAYKDIQARALPDRRVWSIDLEIERPDGKKLSKAVVKEYYFNQDQWWTKPSIHSRASGDLYVTLAESEARGESVVLDLRLNPFVGWLWIGGLVLFAGTGIAAWKGRAPMATRREPSGAYAAAATRGSG